MTQPMLNHRGAATVWAVLPCLVVMGCASVPDAKFFYKPVRWAAAVSAHVTIACSSDSDPEPTILTSTKVTPAYSADDDGTVRTIALRDLNAFYADVDLAVEWFEDGRLKSINASAAGQGAAVLSSLIGAYATFGAGAAVAAASTYPDDKEAKPKTLCGTLPQLLPKDAKSLALTLTYRRSLKQATLMEVRERVKLEPSEESRAAHRALAGFAALPIIEVKAALMKPQPQVALPKGTFEPRRPGDPASYVQLPIQETAYLQLSFYARRGDQEHGLRESAAFDTAQFVVPLDTTQTLAIPIPALFGKAGFSLALAESGRISKLSYAKGSGVAGAIGAVDALAGAESKGTTARAAALNAEADLIAAQTRLAKCRKSAADC